MTYAYRRSMNSIGVAYTWIGASVQLVTIEDVFTSRGEKQMKSLQIIPILPILIFFRAKDDRPSFCPWSSGRNQSEVCSG